MITGTEKALKDRRAKRTIIIALLALLVDLAVLLKPR